MNTATLIRCALSDCVAAAMLAGCGGSQPPIGAPGAMPQTSALATHADRGKSSMLPEARSEDLLYASNQGDASSEYGDVLIFAYPEGKLVGTLTGFSAFVQSLCSDRSGNVFVTASTTDLSQGYVYEYSHGGTQPVATLSDQGIRMVALAIQRQEIWRSQILTPASRATRVTSPSSRTPEARRPRMPIPTYLIRSIVAMTTPAIFLLMDTMCHRI